MNGYSTSQIAKLVGVHPNTVRMYEEWGLIETAKRYEVFLTAHQNKKVLFMEFGIGMNTPVTIKYPFLRMTINNPNATYACINKGEAFTLEPIADRSICVDGDISRVIDEL